MSGIRQAELVKVTLELPSVAEQRVIAEVLGALDDKIESNRRLQRTLLDLATAVYELAVRDVRLTGYETALELDLGSPFKGEYFTTPGVGRPVVRIRDLKTFVPQVWTTERRDDEHVVSPGDVLVGMDAEFRSTIWTGQPGVLNQRMCRFRPRDGVARVFALLGIRDDLDFCERAKSGTTVIHLNKSDIERFQVPALSPAEHDTLRQKADPLIERVVIAAKESRDLAAIRDALLPELLMGRMRVKDAERVAEE